MHISYDICDLCGRKIEAPNDAYLLHIGLKYEDYIAGRHYDLCRECAKKATEYYDTQRESIQEKQKTA